MHVPKTGEIGMRAETKKIMDALGRGFRSVNLRVKEGRLKYFFFRGEGE